jgi:putative transposase
MAPSLVREGGQVQLKSGSVSRPCPTTTRSRVGPRPASVTEDLVAPWKLGLTRTELISAALGNAAARDPDPGVIFHSDRGCQGGYTSGEFARFCQANSIRTSTGRTGVCWDKAAAESFFAALKNESTTARPSPAGAHARFAVADYIEVFYNRQRLHSTMGYRTPAEALTDYQAAATAA